MLRVKAKVRGGRLVLDEPTDLPEGEEVELVGALHHDGDDLDEVSRAALHAALRRSAEDLARGRLVDGDVVLAELRTRSGH